MPGVIQRGIQRILKAMPKPPYESAAYWDKIYADTFRQQGAVEWGLPPPQLLRYEWMAEGAARDAALDEHAAKDADVVVVGCGNSRLSEAMAVSGWDASKLVSVDFSPTSIEQAAERARLSGDKRLSDLRYVVADCRSLHTAFAPKSFDTAVDKGLLDALYCSPAAKEAIPATARSVLRILRPGGCYVSLHSGGVMGLAPPAHLQEYMADARWATCEIRQLVPRSDGLYLYIWTKAGKPPQLADKVALQHALGRTRGKHRR